MVLKGNKKISIIKKILSSIIAFLIGFLFAFLLDKNSYNNEYSNVISQGIVAIDSTDNDYEIVNESFYNNTDNNTY